MFDFILFQYESCALFIMMKKESILSLILKIKIEKKSWFDFLLNLISSHHFYNVHFIHRVYAYYSLF